MTEIEKRQDRSPVPSAFDYAPAPESREIVTLEDRYGLFIGGEWVKAEGGRTFAVEDPSTGESLCDIADASPADGMRALDAAVAAQAGWAKHPPRVP